MANICVCRFEGSEDNYTIPKEFDEQNPESCASQKYVIYVIYCRML